MKPCPWFNCWWIQICAVFANNVLKRAVSTPCTEDAVPQQQHLFLLLILLSSHPFFWEVPWALEGLTQMSHCRLSIQPFSARWAIMSLCSNDNSFQKEASVTKEESNTDLYAQTKYWEGNLTCTVCLFSSTTAAGPTQVNDLVSLNGLFCISDYSF